MSDTSQTPFPVSPSWQPGPPDGPDLKRPIEPVIHPIATPYSGSLDETNPWSAFRPVDVEDLFSQSHDAVPWIIKGFLARGTLSLLVGPPKVGKTTLAYQLIESVALGHEFLGQEVTAAKVLLLGLEEHKRDIIARLREKSGESLKGKVKVVFGPLPCSPIIHEQMAQYIGKEQIGLVIVDTIPAWFGLTDENDASEVLRKGFPLLNIIRQTEAAWLGLGHTRKSGGGHGQDIRGSSALAGLVDVALSMKRTESGGMERLLEAISRYIDTPEKLVLEFHDRAYQVLGTPDEVSAEGKAKQVWDALSDEGWTTEQLAEVVGLSKQDVSRAIQRLGEKVSKDGEGHRGSPYRYRRNLIHP